MFVFNSTWLNTDDTKEYVKTIVWFKSSIHPSRTTLFVDKETFVGLQENALNWFLLFQNHVYFLLCKETEKDKDK